MKRNYIGFTRSLAIAGCSDFRWVQEEDRWKGSEVHRLAELRLRYRLDRDSVPQSRRGYLDAIDAFLRETCFIATHIEQKVEDRALGVRGRIDAAGVMRGKATIVDFKTGAINPATALQLCLGGHCLDPGHWWQRCAVHLKANGQYSMKVFPLKEWHADLTTALAAVRVAQWKVREGLA